ncbi:hypothetical protein ACHAWO_011206 [Cyclotella atomus]|uniref:Uncharacterized protein n=1 Tax=Cyclotella atomus TaxID=382360 RepID=A0ABD3NVI2_9STRA
MTTRHDTSSRKKQRSEYAQTPKDETMMDTDADTTPRPPLNIQSIPHNNVTRGGPSGPSWSCRGCGRCNIHHTVPVHGCWACMQITLNGPTFDADRWGDFTICQQMKEARLAKAT